MDLPQFLNNISFRLVHPNTLPGIDGWFRVNRGSKTSARLLHLPDVALDLINTRLPDGDITLKARLRDLAFIPRMSSFAVSAIIQYTVSAMRPGTSFVNVGLWNGYTFLSGLVGNPDKRCVGIDDFSQFGGPRDAFAERFQQHCSGNHQFFDMDYRKYFESVHEGPIGFYIYDGEHSYANQLLGLQIAEKYFTDDCVIMVDDTNWPEPRRAIRDFVASSDFGYRVLFDRTTLPYSGRLTFWNGLTILQRIDRRQAIHYSEQPPTGAWGSQVPDASESPGNSLVSLLITHEDPNYSLEAALSGALGQSGAQVELLVNDCVRDANSRSAIGRYGSAIREVDCSREATGYGLEPAIDQSSGDFIAFAESVDKLPATCIANALESGNKLAHWVSRQMRVAQRIAELVPESKKFILVDDQQFNRQVAAGRQSSPFLERSGCYWGNPTASSTAIRELERMRSGGAAYIVFGWPAFWWLDKYPEFFSHLNIQYERIFQDDLLLVYDLK